MKIIIMGCGRVGARLAGILDGDGHDVTILDIDSYSLRRLPSAFGGKALIGNGTEQDSLRHAGIETTDVFIAVTQGDNRNVMACQIAKIIVHVPKAICRIYDPLRQELYLGLGIEAVSPTTIFAQILIDKIEEK